MKGEYRSYGFGNVDKLSKFRHYPYHPIDLEQNSKSGLEIDGDDDS